MNVVLWIIAWFLAVAFAGAGAMKLTQNNEALAARGMQFVEDFSPAWIKLIGTVEVAGAFGLIVPAVLHIAPVLAPMAASALGILMSGAVAVHLRRREGGAVIPPLTLGLLAAFLAVSRFGPYAL